MFEILQPSVFNLTTLVVTHSFHKKFQLLESYPGDRDYAGKPAKQEIREKIRLRNPIQRRFNVRLFAAGAAAGASVTLSFLEKIAAG